MMYVLIPIIVTAISLKRTKSEKALGWPPVIFDRVLTALMTSVATSFCLYVHEHFPVLYDVPAHIRGWLG